jgi:2'-5' RNA ligase
MAYWLVPSEPDLSTLQDSVSNFAKRFNGPEFEPHLTIYFGLFNQTDSPELILKSLAFGMPLVLKPRELLFSDSFTTSCYVKFEESEILSEMSELVRRSIHSPDDYKFVPHMSLFYGRLSAEAVREIQNEFELPKTITFDLLKAIGNPPQVKTAADVNFWYEVARSKLQD